MSKILGLDLGDNSIGWAVVDTDKNKLLNFGLRIFPTSLTQGRLKKRSARRFLQKQSFIKIGRPNFLRAKVSPFLSALTIIIFLTFILGITNIKNWQFWTNISLTALLSTLTLLHQDRKK